MLIFLLKAFQENKKFSPKLFLLFYHSNCRFQYFSIPATSYSIIARALSHSAPPPPSFCPPLFFLHPTKFDRLKEIFTKNFFLSQKTKQKEEKISSEVLFYIFFYFIFRSDVIERTAGLSCCCNFFTNENKMKNICR